jgi:hypothetical protein
VTWSGEELSFIGNGKGNAFCKATDSMTDGGSCWHRPGVLHKEDTIPSSWYFESQIYLKYSVTVFS